MLYLSRLCAPACIDRQNLPDHIFDLGGLRRAEIALGKLEDHFGFIRRVRGSVAGIAFEDDEGDLIGLQVDIELAHIDFLSDLEIPRGLPEQSSGDGTEDFQFSVLVRLLGHRGISRRNAENAAFLDDEDSARLDDHEAGSVRAALDDLVLPSVDRSAKKHPGPSPSATDTSRPAPARSPGSVNGISAALFMLLSTYL